MSIITQLFTQLPKPWPLILVGLLLPVLSLLVLARRSSAGKGLKLPPGPPRLPVIGNLHQMSSLPHRSLRDLARRHGPVMLLQLGATQMLVVSSPSAAREVLKTHDADCCNRAPCPGQKLLSYGYKDLVFASYDDGWRDRRKVLVSEFLSGRAVSAARGARQEQVDVLMAALTKASNTPVALSEHIFSLVDGIVGKVALGSVHGQVAVQNCVYEAMELFGGFSGEDFFPNAAGRLVDRITGIVARRQNLFAELDAFFEVLIEEHLKPGRRDDGDLVDALINLSTQEGSGITREHIKALIMNTFVGGVEPTSVTVLWAMSELIRKPRILKKVQDEIRAAVGRGGNTRVQPDDLPKLGYLKLVIKETLRLYPPATLLAPRETMRQVTIGGYDVPAKTRVSVNVWAIGRDTAIWGEDAEEFQPGRFLNKEVDIHGAHFELLPFGSGRRICPGIAMAMMNAEFVLANMLCGFDWALPEGVKAEDLCMEEAGGITFHRKSPLVLVPTPYSPIPGARD